MSNHQNEELAEYIHEHQHDDDCTVFCFGCNKSFCQIKESENCDHHKPLEDAVYYNDAVYCSDHCNPY